MCFVYLNLFFLEETSVALLLTPQGSKLENLKCPHKSGQKDHAIHYVGSGSD